MIKTFFLLFFLLLSSLFADLEITSDKDKYDNFSIEYLYDETNKLTISEIQEKDFPQIIPSQFTQGYKYGNAWFKIEIKNRTSNEYFILQFTESIWASLDLYFFNNGSWEIEKNGLDIPLKSRAIEDIMPTFSLHIPPNQKKTFYVRGNTIASQIGEFKLYTQSEYYSPHRISLEYWYIIYAFVLLTFILLNLYNFFATQEKIYAYYILYIFIYIIFSFMHSGIYTYLGFANWNEGLHTVGQLTLFALLMFSMEFLELEKTYPLMKKYFQILAVLSLIFAILLSQNLSYATFASNIFFSGVLIFIVYVAIQILKKGFIDAKYYLLALIVYLPSMTMMAMTFNTLLPNTDLTRYSFLFAAFVEIFLFTVLLANRYMKIHYEKLRAQKALIEEKSKNEKSLEKEVELKTKSLRDANEQLMKQKMELEDAKRQLTHDSQTDILSGLYNRRYFYQASQRVFYEAVRYKHPLSLIMIDIDKFKQINDTYGHTFGDKVIRVVSKILLRAVRNSDILARYGGEEFVILLPQSDKDGALLLANRIRENIQNQEIELNKASKISVTISMGVTQLDAEHDHEIEDAILRCDKALYNAKNGGRNRVNSL